ncbi:MAG TPA: hypothetical protein VMW54_10315 [Terriglobia bacterium]|nr:hypothetical protein [Terriglobia bacterium]
MGGFGYDRQVFVKSKQTATSPSPSRSPLPGALVLIVVAALGALAAYRYIKAGGLSNTAVSSNTQVVQLRHKIELMQARIDELEKKRRPSVTTHTEEAKSISKPQPKAAPVLSAELAHRPLAHAADAPVPKPVVAASPQPKHSPQIQSATTAKPDPGLKLLQGNLSASHQEWEATVNRLGNVVGELDTQRNQVAQNQNAVNQLLQITRRTGIPFSLKKQSRFERVGPISIKLARTNVQNQRYTLRLIVDDKSVELKDRALNEVIQFYTQRSQFPVELVVSDITRGHVSGMLAVPNDLDTRDQNSQAQAR